MSPLDITFEGGAIALGICLGLVMPLVAIVGPIRVRPVYIIQLILSRELCLEHFETRLIFIIKSKVKLKSGIQHINIHTHSL